MVAGGGSGWTGVPAYSPAGIGQGSTETVTDVDGGVVVVVVAYNDVVVPSADDVVGWDGLEVPVEAVGEPQPARTRAKTATATRILPLRPIPSPAVRSSWVFGIRMHHVWSPGQWRAGRQLASTLGELKGTKMSITSLNSDCCWEWRLAWASATRTRVIPTPGLRTTSRGRTQEPRAIGANAGRIGGMVRARMSVGWTWAAPVSAMCERSRRSPRRWFDPDGRGR
jgi:hypothetical protein